MAYPTVSAPYGLKPVNLIGGQVFAGSTRMLPIASGYNTNIFYGDVVQITTDGTIIKNATTNGTSPVAGVIGVFLGVEYTSPSTLQKLRAQYWPAGTTASDAVAYVCDDPDTVFKAVICSTGSTVAAAGQWTVGNNVALIQNTGSTSTGDSAVAVGGTPASSGYAMRVVQLVPDTQITATASATTSGSSTTVTLAAATTLYPYMTVSGSGVSAGNYIASVTNSTTIVLATAINLASATTLTFVGSPEVLVKFNFGWHSYYNATGV